MLHLLPRQLFPARWKHPRTGSAALVVTRAAQRNHGLVRRMIRLQKLTRARQRRIRNHTLVWGCARYELLHFVRVTEDTVAEEHSG